MRPAILVVAFLGVSVTSGIGCQAAQAQWWVGAEVGSDRFWGGTEESTAEQRSFRPYRPTTFGIGLARRAGKVGAGLRLRYSSASLALEGEDALVAAKGIFAVYSAAPELVYRLTGIASNELVLHGGPLFEVWSSSGEDSQTRLGLQVGASLIVPLAARLAGSLTAEAAVIPSPFTDAELDPSFDRRALWRRRVAGGLEYRL